MIIMLYSHIRFIYLSLLLTKLNQNVVNNSILIKTQHYSPKYFRILIEVILSLLWSNPSTSKMSTLTLRSIISRDAQQFHKIKKLVLKVAKMGLEGNVVETTNIKRFAIPTHMIFFMLISQSEPERAIPGTFKAKFGRSNISPLAGEEPEGSKMTIFGNF